MSPYISSHEAAARSATHHDRLTVHVGRACLLHSSHGSGREILFSLDQHTWRPSAAEMSRMTIGRACDRRCARNSGGYSGCAWPHCSSPDGLTVSTRQ